MLNDATHMYEYWLIFGNVLYGKGNAKDLGSQAGPVAL